MMSKNEMVNVKNTKFTKHLFFILIIANYLPNYFCGICDLCSCTQSDDSRIIDCQGKSEIDNYTEIFDLLAFEESKVVKKLVITQHDITALPLDAFRGLSSLRFLDLSENGIDSFESNIFKDLKNLEQLDFSFNRLTNLNGAVFNNIESLSVLNLSHNLIADLNETTAGQLPKLTSLDLSHNFLKTIDNEFIKSLDKLKFLDVSYNRITSVSSDILLALGSLNELRINNNLLKFVSGENLPQSLEILNVAGNMITSMPPDLSQIRNLNIACNNISAIKTENWLKKLQHLNTSGNLLNSFPNFTFDELKTLDLSSNDFSFIPKNLSFANLPILETLLIDDNPIKDLKFVEELHLKKLYVRRLEKLETIAADALEKIEGINEGCVNLTISENPRLNRIEEGALNSLSLCYLDLSKNAFTHISSGVIKSKNKFVAERGIDLQGNPFNCECRSQWMLNDLVPFLYEINSALLEDLRCKTPLELSGVRMVHWFMWKNRVFCDSSSNVLSKMRMDTTSVMARSETSVRLESSRGMLAIVAGAMGTLCILIIVGIVLARKLEIRKRRTNRRF